MNLRIDNSYTDLRNYILAKHNKDFGASVSSFVGWNTLVILRDIFDNVKPEAAHWGNSPSCSDNSYRSPPKINNESTYSSCIEVEFDVDTEIFTIWFHQGDLYDGDPTGEIKCKWAYDINKIPDDAKQARMKEWIRLNWFEGHVHAMIEELFEKEEQLRKLKRMQEILKQQLQEFGITNDSRIEE